MKYFAYFTNLDFIVFYVVLILSGTAIFYQKFHRNSSSLDAMEYLLMGRRISLPIFVATLVSTWYGAILGVTQISFERGIYNFVTQGFFYYISAAFFAAFLVKKAIKTEAKTFPEMISVMYGPKSGRLAAIILLATSLPAGSAIAMGIYMSGVFPDISVTWAILIGLMFVGVYTMYGGMQSIVICDTIQFLLMYITIICVVVCSYLEFGGLDYLYAKLPEYYFYPISNQSIMIFFVWMILALANTFLSPVFYQRCFAAKSESVARKGIFISIIFWFICDLCTTLGGMYAKAHFFDANPLDGYLIYSLYILPIGLKGLFLASMLIIIISALDSSLFTASSALFYDLSRDKTSIIKMRKKTQSMFCVVLATSALAIQFENSIEQAWLTLNSISLSLVLVPILFGFAKRNFISDKACSRVILVNIMMSLIWIASGLDAKISVFYIGVALSFIMFLAIKRRESI